MGPLGFEPRTDGLKVTSSRFILAILALPLTTTKNASKPPALSTCEHIVDYLRGWPDS